MLECALCDYFQKLGAGKGTAKCVFTNFLFLHDPELLDIEYPCRNVSYAEYLKNREILIEADGSKPDDWRFAYLRGRAPSAMDRYLRRSM